MIKRFVLIFLILVFIFLGGVSAVLDGETVKYVNYNFYSNLQEYFELKYNTVKVIVNTPEDAILCKYDSDNVGFDFMDGNFDLSSGVYHEKTFVDLTDGIYTYYVKCDTTSLNGSEPAVLELVLRVNSLVTAQIVLGDDPPLQAGRTELTLLTSKVVANSPSLSYSFDNLVYTNLPLIGSGIVWKGSLIIPKNLKDAIVSFKFSANDLEGRQGTQIISGNYFDIDTVNPSVILDIAAVGLVGEIELEWHLPGDDDIVEYNLYRSNSPNLDYTDYYTVIQDEDDTSYRDTSVEKGKTYYYRITGIDEAGNEGDLSKEVFATVLKENASVGVSGLAPYLLGIVENFAVEIDSVIDDVDGIKSNWDDASANEKGLYSDLGLQNDLKNVRSELVVLQNDAEKLKLQDLTQNELDNRISSLRTKMEVIKKKIPERLIVLDQDSNSQSFIEEDLRVAFLELDNTLTEKDISKGIKETNLFVEERNIRVEGNYYQVEIDYLDGSSKTFSVVSRVINGEVELSEGMYFVEIVSKDVAEDSNSVNFLVGDSSVVNPDPVFSFKTDTKRIVYSIDGKISLSRLSESKFVFVKIPPVDDISGSNITGYFFGGLDTIEYGGIGLGILVVILLVYFIFIRRKKRSVEGEEVSRKIDILLDCLNRKNLGECKIIYGELQNNYKLLGEKEKKNFHKILLEVHEKIVGLEIEKLIDGVSISRDKEELKKIDLLYQKLSEHSRKKIESVYSKLKKDFETNG